MLLPICVVVALVLVSQGVIQNLAPYREVTTLEGAKQIARLGPVASQEAIKELGTNGGGFFNANSAHPFENPTPLTNFIELLLIFAIPAGADLHLRPHGARTSARAGRSSRPWPCCSSPASTSAYWAEAGPNPALRRPRASTSPRATWRARRSASASPNSALFATVTTDASCGAVNSMHDSFTPLGGLVPLVNIQLGEVIFGGVGAGLYGMLVFVVLTVFIAGLMVGRTPEYLGKKIEAREMKLADALRAHLPARSSSCFTAWAAVAPYGDVVAQQRRAARAVRDPLRLHERRRQQRLGLRRPERQHAVLEHRRSGLDHAGRPLPA